MPMPRKPSELDEKTWRAATADIKPLKKKRTVPKALTPEQLAKKPIKPKAAFVVRAASNARAYDAKLDLHGLTESAAHSTLMAWVGQQVKRGARRLLVITGKGAKGSSIIRTNVPRWLDVPPTAQNISGIEQAPPTLGGKGAYIIKLTKRV